MSTTINPYTPEQQEQLKQLMHDYSPPIIGSRVYKHPDLWAAVGGHRETLTTVPLAYLEFETSAPPMYDLSRIIPMRPLPAPVVIIIPDLEPYKTDEAIVTKTCPECDGEGTVKWTYRHYESDHDCPICDGQAEITTGKITKMLPWWHTCQIGHRYFKTHNIALLERLQKITGDPVYLLSDCGSDESRAAKFKCGPFEVLIMPLMGYPEDRAEQNLIKIFAIEGE